MATTVWVASPVPKAATMDSGASSAPRKLAAETFARAEFTAKFIALDTPLPGAGLKTVTLAAPAAAMSVAGIAAVNCVALVKVVVRLFPFQRTVAPLTKFAPVTVSVKPWPPATAELGFKPVSIGTGLSPVWLTVKVCGPMVNVPVRGLPVVLAATAKLTVPLPAPLAPEVMVSHVVLLVAVQVQLLGEVTEMVPVPPVAEKD